MKEKEFQTIFANWHAANLDFAITEFGDCAAFELKMCRGTSFPFNAVQPHQKEALTAATSGDGVFHKITDVPVSTAEMRFTRKKPFDCFYMNNAQGWLAIMLYTKGQRKAERETVFIRIGDWLEAEAAASRKSVRRDELRKLGLVLKLENKNPAG